MLELLCVQVGMGAAKRGQEGTLAPLLPRKFEGYKKRGIANLNHYILQNKKQLIVEIGVN